MPRIFRTLIWTAALGLLAVPAVAQEMSNDELMQELQKTQQRLKELEQKLQDRQAAPASQAQASPREMQGISEGVREVEEKLQDTPLLGGLSHRLSISGVIEAEAGYEDRTYNNPSKQDEESSDITLATMELGIDADISKYVSGHFLLLWEEDDPEPVDLDAFEGEPAVAETFHGAVREIARDLPVSLAALRRKSELVAGLQADLTDFG